MSKNEICAFYTFSQENNTLSSDIVKLFKKLVKNKILSLKNPNFTSKKVM